MQFFSDPERENSKCAMSDCEVFWMDQIEAREYLGLMEMKDAEPGYYYRFCFSGCLPEYDCFGPFKTEQLAIDDCREVFLGE